MKGVGGIVAGWALLGLLFPLILYGTFAFVHSWWMTDGLQVLGMLFFVIGLPGSCVLSSGVILYGARQIASQMPLLGRVVALVQPSLFASYFFLMGFSLADYASVALVVILLLALSGYLPFAFWPASRWVFRRGDPGE